MKYRKLISVMFFCMFVFSFSSFAAKEVKVAEKENAEEIAWSYGNGKNAKVFLYFFHSNTCPHCQKAKPFINSIDNKYDWLVVKSYEVSRNRENSKFLFDVAAKAGAKITSVPAFAYCGSIEAGFMSDEVTGQRLENSLLQCHKSIVEGAFQVDKKSSKVKTTDDIKVNIPILGELDTGEFALPIITIIIAGADAFNPCAFFILLFLLSLMVNAKSRLRMALIGGVFVFFSGFVYFAFMSAWLNAFLQYGELGFITIGAGIIALVFSIINIKDYFFFKMGISLSIPEWAKPGLYKRMRDLVNANSFWAMLTGTVLLAVLANLYELLCTVGFPMIYTRILTLRDLETFDYYAYLVFYNIVYVIPLVIIVILFIYKFSSRKLSEDEGRVLKLLSGYMMFILAMLLVFWPEALNQFLIAIGLILVSIVVTLVTIKAKSIVEFHKKKAKK